VLISILPPGAPDPGSGAPQPDQPADQPAMQPPATATIAATVGPATN